MPNTLTESALVAIQEKIESVFPGDTPTKYGYNVPGHTIAGLMERHSAQLRPHLNQGGQVIGYEVNYLVSGADTVTEDDDPSAVGENLDCDVAAGVFPESGKKSYEHNKAIVSNVTVDDNLVGNLFNDRPASKDGRERAATLIAERFKKARADVRTRLDQWGIDFLHATRTPINNDATLPANITFNATDDRFESAAANFQSADFLTDIDALVANNRMNGYFMVSGRRNFYNAIVDARFRRQNDNERYLTRFDTADIYFDIRNLDQRLGAAAPIPAAGTGFTFAVGDGTYALWNYADVTPSPVQIDDDKWRFTVEDEFLMINDNGLLRPVVYEVLYQKVCVNRDAILNPYFDHRFEIRFLGGLVAAPADGDGHTGILEMIST